MKKKLINRWQQWAESHTVLRNSTENHNKALHFKDLKLIFENDFESLRQQITWLRHRTFFIQEHIQTSRDNHDNVQKKFTEKERCACKPLEVHLRADSDLITYAALVLNLIRLIKN